MGVNFQGLLKEEEIVQPAKQKKPSYFSVFLVFRGSQDLPAVLLPFRGHPHRADPVFYSFRNSAHFFLVIW